MIEYMKKSKASVLHNMKKINEIIKYLKDKEIHDNRMCITNGWTTSCAENSRAGCDLRDTSKCLQERRY